MIGADNAIVQLRGFFVGLFEELFRFGADGMGR
jgi:hypothetical protein